MGWVRMSERELNRVEVLAQIDNDTPKGLQHESRQIFYARVRRDIHIGRMRSRGRQAGHRV